MDTWIDFADLKQRLNLASVLRQYHVSLRRSGRDQYRGRCPIHCGDSREAFHANLTKNVFHCFACGAGGTVLDFVAAMERCTLREAALRLQTATGQPAVQHFAIQLVTKKSIIPSPLSFALRGVDSGHPYLAARGIAAATAEKFGVGFYCGCGVFSGRMVIPIHNAHGELVAYCGRAVDGTQPRYRFPSGFPKSEILFNLHRAVAAGQPTAVVVEGFFDCLKLYQAGITAVLALMGAALYESQQRQLLERFRRVILMLDGDEAGRRATTTIAARLQRHASVEMIHLPDSVQPDQLSTADIRQFLQARTPATRLAC